MNSRDMVYEVRKKPATARAPAADAASPPRTDRREAVDSSSWLPLDVLPRMWPPVTRPLDVSRTSWATGKKEEERVSRLSRAEGAGRRTCRGAYAASIVRRGKGSRRLVDAVDDGLDGAADGIKGRLRQEDERERGRVERDRARAAGAVNGDRLLLALERAVRRPRAASSGRLASPGHLRVQISSRGQRSQLLARTSQYQERTSNCSPAEGDAQ
jgi:hypothetical protein